jgi:hypothetical protein
MAGTMLCCVSRRSETCCVRPLIGTRNMTVVRELQGVVGLLVRRLGTSWGETAVTLHVAGHSSYF